MPISLTPLFSASTSIISDHEATADENVQSSIAGLSQMRGSSTVENYSTASSWASAELDVQFPLQDDESDPPPAYQEFP